MVESGKPGSELPPREGGGPWWAGLSRYMWWVLIVSALGWVFDVMDQRIFVLSRNPALDELLSVSADPARLERGTAGEVAALLGLPAPADPSARVRIDPAAAPNGRDLLVLPPAAGGKAGEARGANGARGADEQAERKLAIVRPEGSTEVHIVPPPERTLFIGRIVTAIFLAGWATGGLLFGILGDRWGRAYTMVLTILVYSVFTGLSALSVSWIDYGIYRFLTGMGVGGEFAAGAALVAEVMPARARPYALGLLQTLSAVGNILGSMIGWWVLPTSDMAREWEDWRLLYLVGILPALLIVVIRGRLKEPERWRAAKESSKELIGKKLGAFGDLFVPPWKRSTLFGLLFAASGVLGLWGIGFWTPELIRGLVPPADRSVATSSATALQDVGAFFGLAAITLLTQGAPRWRWPVYAGGLAVSLGLSGLFLALGAGSYERWLLTSLLGVSLAVSLYFIFAAVGSLSGGLGRRISFAVAFLAAFAATVAVFGFMERDQIFWMIPVLGFLSLLCFGLYAIYFPELYPTRLRTTGTGFCYNVARYLAAGGIFLLGSLPLSLRHSAVIFASIYLVGLLGAFFAPETKDRPLVEE